MSGFERTIQITGNPNYPLPPDYDDLTKEGRRQARVAACRQWYLYGPSKEKQYAFVKGLQFFDNYYLRKDPDTGFNPNFYKFWLPSPQGHYTIYSAMMARRLIAAVAPRGYAKSSAMLKPMIMMAASVPKFDIGYITANHDLTSVKGDEARFQLYYNARLNDDFAPAYGTTSLQPVRGTMQQGIGGFRIVNRSLLEFRSIEGKLRGMRPSLMVIDDPEADAKESTSMEQVRKGMRELVTNVLMPMVQHPVGQLVWPGTYVSRRHLLWHVMKTEKKVVDGVMKEAAADPFYNSWYRIHIPALYEDSSGTIHSCWPEMWPTDAEERKDLVDRNRTYETAKIIPEVRTEMGEPAFQAEMMGRPGAGGAAWFPNIREEGRDKHGWWLTDLDENAIDNPLHSEATINWYHVKQSDYSKRAMRLSDFLKRYARAMPIDTSYTATKDSDRKAFAVVAQTEEGDRFVLDGWSDQCEQHVLIRNAFQAAERWMVTSIHPEAIREGMTLVQELEQIVVNKADQITGGSSYFPRIVKLNPGQTDKTSRIASCQPTVASGMWKLPWHRLDEPGFFQRLAEQLTEFDPYARDGGLEKDDELDTAIQMPRFIFRGKASRQLIPSEAPKTPLEKLRDGDNWDDAARMPNSVLAYLSAERTGQPIGEVFKAMQDFRDTHPEEEDLLV